VAIDQLQHFAREAAPFSRRPNLTSALPSPKALTRQPPPPLRRARRCSASSRRTRATSRPGRSRTQDQASRTAKGGPHRSRPFSLLFQPHRRGKGGKVESGHGFA
jgi:hypothetical protein